MKLVENIKVSKELQYHIDNNLPLNENVFRPNSEKYFQLFNEVRELFNENKIRLTEDDIFLVESDLGKKVKLSNGETVWLDTPIVEEEYDSLLSEAEYQGKNVELNKPKRGGAKKYYVYVKNPSTGNIKKVSFGDVHGGLTAKVSNPKARKAFAARHNCKDKKDKTKAGYWACRVNRFANLWNGQTYPGFW